MHARTSLPIIAGPLWGDVGVICLDDAAPRTSGPGVRTVSAGEPRPAPCDHIVRCAACAGRITRQDAAASRNGGHSHVFCNPAGLVFQLLVYRDAPGCVALDPPSLEFTWFHGYWWRVAACRVCAAHLGWRFDDAVADVFFGLIADRIVAGPGPD